MADPAMTVSSERVERVARALAAHEYERDNGHPMPSDFAGPDYQWGDWVPDARAAIESLSITEGEVEQRARELSPAEKDRRIEIGLKMLTARWPIAASLSAASLTDILNAMEDFAALSLPSTVRGEVIEECAKEAERHYAGNAHDSCGYVPRYIAAAIRALKGKPTPEGEG